MKSARQVAFEALLKVHRDGAYSNLAVDSLLKENNGLELSDRLIKIKTEIIINQHQSVKSSVNKVTDNSSDGCLPAFVYG